MRPRAQGMRWTALPPPRTPGLRLLPPRQASACLWTGLPRPPGLSRGLVGLGGLPPAGAPFPAPPPPPMAHRPDSTLIAALVTARAAAAEGRARVREAALAWERERDAADALARQIADAEQFLGLPASPDVGTTSSGSASVVWHDPADPHVVQLHYQASRT